MVKTIKILVIDDDPKVRKILKNVLESEGYEVFLATNGEEGLRMQGEHPCDVVILEAFMPGKDGFETQIELKKYHPKVRTIAISASNNTSPSLDALPLMMRLGAAAALKKPLSCSEVLSAVSTALQPLEQEAPIKP